MCRQNSAQIYKNSVRCKFAFQRLIFRLINICIFYKLFLYILSQIIINY